MNQRDFHASWLKGPMYSFYNIEPRHGPASSADQLSRIRAFCDELVLLLFAKLPRFFSVHYMLDSHTKPDYQRLSSPMNVTF
jgi:hypothetical protein